MSLNISDLTVAQLKQAIVIKEKIESLESEMAALLGSAPKKLGRPAKTKDILAAFVKVRKPRKQFSEEAKAKMAAAQKARWAKIKAVKRPF